jgi:hypothetical protein
VFDIRAKLWLAAPSRSRSVRRGERQLAAEGEGSALHRGEVLVTLHHASEALPGANFQISISQFDTLGPLCNHTFITLNTFFSIGGR